MIGNGWSMLSSVVLLSLVFPRALASSVWGKAERRSTMIRTNWLRFLTHTISAWGLGLLFTLAGATPAQGLFPMALGDCPGGIQTGDFTLKVPGEVTTGALVCSSTGGTGTGGTGEAFDMLTYGCYKELHLKKAGGTPPVLPNPHFEIELQGYCSIYRQHVSKTPGGQWGYGIPEPTGWTEVVIKGSYVYSSHWTIEKVVEKATNKLLLETVMNCPKNPWAYGLTCGATSINNKAGLPVSAPYPLSAAKVFYMKHSKDMVFGQYLQQVWEKGKTLPPEMEIIPAPLIVSPAPSQVFTDTVWIKLGWSPKSQQHTANFYFDRKEGNTWVNKPVVVKTGRGGSLYVPKSDFGGQGRWRLVVGTGFSFSPPRYFCIDISPCSWILPGAIAPFKKP